MRMQVKVEKEDRLKAEAYSQSQYGISYPNLIALLTKRIAHAVDNEEVSPSVQKLINEAVKGQTTGDKKFSNIDELYKDLGI
ncbi:hypothetical protein [Furfurilactobacillus rossiae]|nr:hypothetical protein [Furfurilactobacillus rossiae]QFR66141.1 hypothetical protein LR814_03005 [Furfurilactobacillus rossiae]QLE61571.1 hypothetical protein LROSRS0_1525 [Furfurilactobacillus rossiae]